MEFVRLEMQGIAKQNPDRVHIPPAEGDRLIRMRKTERQKRKLAQTRDIRMSKNSARPMAKVSKR